MEQLFAAHHGLLAGRAEQACLQRQQLQRLHQRVEADVLQGDAGDAADALSLSDDVVAADGRPAAAGQGQGGQDFDGRALARAIGAEEAEDAPRLDAQRHIFHGDDATGILLAQVFDDDFAVGHREYSLTRHIFNCASIPLTITPYPTIVNILSSQFWTTLLWWGNKKRAWDHPRPVKAIAIV